MKLVEIKCPFCGGKIDREKIENSMVTCEYCGNVFYLDDEKQNYITNYNIIQTTEKKQGNTASYVICGVVGAVVLFGLIGISGINRESASRHVTYEKTWDVTADSEAEQTEEKEYAVLLEKLFGHPADQVSREELDSIRYLGVHMVREQVQITSSTEDPYDKEDAAKKSILLDREEWDAGAVSLFTGLQRLEFENSSLPQECELDTCVHLQGLICTELTAKEAAERVKNPEQIRELVLEGADCLEGVEQFTGLEKLTVNNVQGQDLKALVPLKTLKALTVIDTLEEESLTGEKAERVKDYSALATMTGLERLSIESDVLRDISFVQGLSQLKSLEITDTGVISLEGIASLNGLQELSLRDNNEVKDYSPVEQMSGLTRLVVKKLTSQPDPSLAGLQSLNSLEISGFMDVSGVGSLSGLRELRITGCNLESAGALSALTGLESLTLCHVWKDAGNLTNLNFISELTNLRRLDLADHGKGGYNGFSAPLEIYGDVSAVFALPQLEELYLDGDCFELNFDQIGQSETLRILGLSNMELHENYYVESDGFATSVWYDDVTLDEHTDFLKNFPNLEELYLGSNELTNLDFAKNLPHLKRLEIQDNYITDLSPLEAAGELEYLDITENPVSGQQNLRQGVEILR